MSTKAKTSSSKKRGRIAVFIVEFALILALLAVVFKLVLPSSGAAQEGGPSLPGSSSVGSGNGGPFIASLDQEDIVIHSEVEQNEEMKGYWNIALFGVDAVTDDQLFGGSRSDSTMIASVNMDTGEIRLVSVYRDTYLNVGDGRYRKCNHAYFAGGAKQAINMLNENMDMNISDFVTVGYQALVDVVNGVGGVWIDVDSAELRYINDYQYSIIRDTMQGATYTEVTQTGMQLLDGLQAAAYCRIRYTKGDDFKRAERQREVLKAIQDQAKKADLNTLIDVFNKAVGNIYTSIDQKDILELIGKVADYTIVDEGGFPTEDMRTTATLGSKGSCVIPLDLESNVVWLHQFLFNEADYQVTDTVKEYSAVIRSDTTPYITH